MFERFTKKARQLVVLARQEAGDLGHNYIGTEHLLLGALATNTSVAARVLTAHGVEFDVVRAAVEARSPRGGELAIKGHVPFTTRAKTVLELSLREALTLGHNYIGTEHIALGLLRVDGGAAEDVLEALDVDLKALRSALVEAAIEAGPDEAPRNVRRFRLGRASREIVITSDRPGPGDPLAESLLDPESPAAQELRDRGIDPEVVADALRAALADPKTAAARSAVLSVDPVDDKVLLLVTNSHLTDAVRATTALWTASGRTQPIHGADPIARDALTGVIEAITDALAAIEGDLSEG